MNFNFENRESNELISQEINETNGSHFFLPMGFSMAFNLCILRT